MQVADFFCGAGGFSEGFRQAGFSVAFGVDKWGPAVRTFRANHPKAKVLQMDVVEISELPDNQFDDIVPDVEVIIGSPPCQAFSSSNKSGNGDKAEGIALLTAYLRIIARKKFKENAKLKYWILENVPNIESYIKDEYKASDLGLEGDFTLKVKTESAGIYNAKYYGAPTNRKRYLCGDFPEPAKTNNDGNLKTLGDVINSFANFKDDALITDCNYPTLRLASNEVTDYNYKFTVQPHEWKTAQRLKKDRGYMGKMSFPENINKPSRTVMATMSASSRESMILQDGEGGYRLPTVREVASMMGFPIDYWFYANSIGKKYTLVGNAVSPKLSNALAKGILSKERIGVAAGYKRIVHSEDGDFYNLNGKIFPNREEQRKRETAKFKYHIPYLIIAAYRVELTNYHSSFPEKKFIWDAEIHYSQGKKCAAMVQPSVDKDAIPENMRETVTSFLGATSKTLCGFDEFQQRFCLTCEEREKLTEVGPYELLDSIRGLINQFYPDGPERCSSRVTISGYSIPEPIYVGYFILSRLVAIMEGWIS